MNIRISREVWVVVGIIAVSLLVVAGLVRGIWQQMELLRRIRAAEAELTPLIVHAKQRNESLRAELAHVSSPEYAEEWARVFGGMSGSGEIVLLVSVPEDDVAEPSPVVATVVEEEAEAVWIRLWRWMSGAD